MASRRNSSVPVEQALLRAKSEYLLHVTDGHGIGQVNKFFHDKYFDSERSRFSAAQHLLPSKGMVARILRKVHNRIIRRLQRKPRIANPWGGEFTVYIPAETFSSVVEDIVGRSSFGHQFVETSSKLIFKIHDIRKAKYIFARMNLDGHEVERSSILKKRFKNSIERCEVVASESKPLVLSFHKTNEILSVRFQYGYWNEHVIPQH